MPSTPVGVKWEAMLTKRVQLFLDVIVLLLAFWFAYLLRFDFVLPPEWHATLLVQCPLVILLQFVVLNRVGGHDFIWRYTSLAHLNVFIYGMVGSLVLWAGLRLGLPNVLAWGRMPLSVAIIDHLLGFGGILGVRILRRSVYEAYEKRSRQQLQGGAHGAKKAVLLIGAGQVGVSVVRELQRQGGIGLDVKGFVDDDPNKRNMQVIHGLKVLGNSDELPELVRELEIDHVILTIAQASSEEVQRLLAICRSVPVKVRIIPGWAEVIQGAVQLTQIRDVQIEDLLGRDPVELDTASMSRLLASRTVLVTGAGGSIGSELARQVARFAPEKLLLVERAEPSLFQAERALRAEFAEVEIVPLIADVGDEARMRRIFEQHQPAVILHAAAHKHVPLMESNPCEAVKNNVLATRLLGELAAAHQADVFVLISTDKAVRPTSVMGASKRLAELVVQDLNRRHKTRFAAVRFGNVIGSTGSVVPIFQEQIRQGGPVKVTDKRMTRYFMTIPEAAQLVLQAGAMPGEGGEVYVLRMGQPVRIWDLAENLITLSGLRPHDDIQIIETGIRPGEKLYEELVISEEVAETKHPKILISRIAGQPSENLRLALEKIGHAARLGDDWAVRAGLSTIIAEATLEGDARAAVASFIKVLAQDTNYNVRGV